jgi:hypothetical protein
VSGFFGPLLPFFAMMVFSGAVIPGIAWCLGRRRRSALRSGRAVRIGCRIRADQPPYPGEYTAGEMVAALGGPVRFLPKRGAGPMLELPLGGECSAPSTRPRPASTQKSSARRSSI